MSEENAETSTTAESESTKTIETVEAVDITEENNAAEDDEDANLEDLEAEMKKLEEEERKLAAQEAALDQAIEKSSNVPVDDKSVYVGSVDYSTTPEQLKNHFKSCGSIERVTILVNKFTGRPKGFAYVRFVRGFVSFEEF
jgi:polyadenylate-binding protein 2|tara:strand:+ start:114 stop:536 length:423 start_codon:yes stop_codon:yes gene_type:complete